MRFILIKLVNNISGLINNDILFTCTWAGADSPAASQRVRTHLGLGAFNARVTILQTENKILLQNFGDQKTKKNNQGSKSSSSRYGYTKEKPNPEAKLSLRIGKEKKFMKVCLVRKTTEQV